MKTGHPPCPQRVTRPPNLSARGGSDYRGQVFFRPLSDGIVDYDYPDFDDWRTMPAGLCKGVVNPGGLVNDPIECLDS